MEIVNSYLFKQIVLATNIAETTLTIDGIVYVVDSGLVKLKEHNPKSGIDTLTKIRIMKAQAIQRRGRAGRTQPGKCYRLYSQYEFSRMKSEAIPEIQRTNVESVVLQLASLGVRDILQFDFMSPPKLDAVMEALEHLQQLGALDDHMALTEMGRKMSEFPLDPPLAKVLITSASLHCTEEILTIVALLSTQHQNLFVNSKKVRVLANEKKAQFNHPDGDHLTLLKVYNAWRLNYYEREWCRKNFVQYRSLVEAGEIRAQLSDMVESHGLPLLSCGRDTVNIRKAFCSGFFRRLAKSVVRVKGGYSTFTNETALIPQVVFVHPNSSLFPLSLTPEWILYHEVVKTKKAYMRAIVTVEPAWVKQFAPKFVSRMARKYPELGNI
ncbi:ATP-dependent RNA helicase DHX8 [Folsomia candida]|uniref:ATP-dependent RNA helicase DHX8 n=1 Tax=Folsomia candida TaxID=158441 RepID=UPI000B901658|nr:ATP-dependent RNA helicase DHX8 [Folsomia candida]